MRVVVKTEEDMAVRRLCATGGESRVIIAVDHEVYPVADEGIDPVIEEIKDDEQLLYPFRGVIAKEAS